MKIRISKSFGAVSYCLVIFIMAIAINFNSSLRISMYGLVIVGMLGILIMKSSVVWRFFHRYSGFSMWLIWILFLSLVTEIIKYNQVYPGSIIQPIFIWNSVFFGYYLTYSRQQDSCTLLMKIFFWIILIAAAEGFIEFFIKHNLFYSSYGNPWEEYRVSSLFGHPIIYASMLMMGVYIAYFLIKNKIIKWISILLFVFGIYVSKSRSTWLAFIISVAILFLCKFKSKIKKTDILKFMFCIVIVMIFLASPLGRVVINGVINRFSGMFMTNSSTQRLGSIAYIFNTLIREKNLFTLCFGHGEDEASRLMLGTTISIEDFSTTDNQYLLILYNYGLIPLIVLIFYIIRLCIFIINRYQELVSAEIMILINIIAQSICAFFYEVSETKTIGYALFLCIGMEIAFCEIRRTHFEE